MTPKASSVRADGQPDGWLAPRSFRAQVAPDGGTRLVISVPADELPVVHKALLAALGARLSVRYLQLTDRAVGQLPKPVSWVCMDTPAADVLRALESAGRLVWEDGRHQLWVRGRPANPAAPEVSVVLDELGVLYCYPDDLAFRDALEALGVSLGPELGLDARDYVRVELLNVADAQELALIADLRMRQVGA
ncbi:MAG: hypothetical protein EXR69_12075 [Myxococcales bacterium]|nr:hypothetical protein [Myxococcales bacterium]